MKYLSIEVKNSEIFNNKAYINKIIYEIFNDNFESIKKEAFEICPGEIVYYDFNKNNMLNILENENKPFPYFYPKLREIIENKDTIIFCTNPEDTILSLELNCDLFNLDLLEFKAIKSSSITQIASKRLNESFDAVDIYKKYKINKLNKENIVKLDKEKAKNVWNFEVERSKQNISTKDKFIFLSSLMFRDFETVLKIINKSKMLGYKPTNFLAETDIVVCSSEFEISMFRDKLSNCNIKYFTKNDFLNI